MAQVLAICLGACAGALGRWQLGLWLNRGWLPWGTLSANLLGGLLVGVAVAALQHNPHISPFWRLLLVTGFLGALTTFSSFSVEVVEMLMLSRWAPAAATIALNLAGSLAMTVAGIKVTQWALA